MLVVSTDSFVAVCRKVQSIDYWIEGDLPVTPTTPKKGGDGDEANTIKQLRAKLAAINKKPRGGRFSNVSNGRMTYSPSPNGRNARHLAPTISQASLARTTLARFVTRARRRLQPGCVFEQREAADAADECE